MELISSVKTMEEGNPFTGLKQNEDVDGFYNQRRNKSCRAITLSAWLALLSFTLLLVHAILAWIKEITSKEEFWSSADKMFQNYNYNFSVCNQSQTI